MNIRQAIISWIFCAFLATISLLGATHWTSVSIVAALLYVTVPGYLIAQLLELEPKRIERRILHSVALSLALLMFVATAANFLLPLFGMLRPLDYAPLIINCVIAALFVAAVWRAKPGPITKIRLELRDEILLACATLLVPASVLGATILTSGGTNLLSLLTMLGAAAIAITLLVSRREYADRTYIGVLFLIALSLLFLYSLRGAELNGFDVHEEFSVYQAAQTRGIWIPAQAANKEYNGMVSITILPLMIHRLSGISDLDTFKIACQVLFAIVPAILFVFARKYLSGQQSFLVAFLLVCQPWFSRQMPSVVRQEIAFIFFGLLLIIIFADDFTRVQKSLLTVVYMAAMVMSHYSTTFVTVLLLSTALVVILLYDWSRKFTPLEYLYHKIRIANAEHKGPSQRHLRTWMLVVLLIFCYAWYWQVTETHEGFGNFFRHAHDSVNELFSPDTLKSIGSQLAFRTPPYNTQQNLDAYTQRTLYESPLPPTETYQPQEYIGYRIHPVRSPEIPANAFSSTVNLLASAVKFLFNYIFIIFGIGLIVFVWFAREQIDRELAVMCVLGLILLFLIIVIPSIGRDYNITRLYLQLLFFLGIACVIGATTALVFLDPKWRGLVLAALFAFYFLFYADAIAQFTGGAPTISLNNFGTEYEQYYGQVTETAGAAWLGEHREPGSRVYADEIAALRLYAFGNISQVSFDILPGTIAKGGYVYLDTTNTEQEITYARYQIYFFQYNYPIAFLDDQKNLIYSNGGSLIYR